MGRQQTIAWFKRIQRGGGTYSERMGFLERFGAGEAAWALWHSGEFTLGWNTGSCWRWPRSLIYRKQI